MNQTDALVPIQTRTAVPSAEPTLLTPNGLNADKLARCSGRLLTHDVDYADLLFPVLALRRLEPRRSQVKSAAST